MIFKYIANLALISSSVSGSNTNQSPNMKKMLDDMAVYFNGAGSEYDAAYYSKL
jgi:hypothetical protein